MKEGECKPCCTCLKAAPGHTCQRPGPQANAGPSRLLMLLARPWKLWDYLFKKSGWCNKVHQEGILPIDHSFHIFQQVKLRNAHKMFKEKENDAEWRSFNDGFSSKFNNFIMVMFVFVINCIFIFINQVMLFLLFFFLPDRLKGFTCKGIIILEVERFID